MEYEFGDAEDAELANSAVQKKLPKSKLIIAFGIFVLCCVVFAYSMFLKPQYFPKITEGTYIGKIYDVFPNEKTGVEFVVESVPSGYFLFAVQLPDWQPQKQTMVSATDTQLHPIVIRNDKMTLKLVGSVSNDGYKGKVLQQDGKYLGRWELKAVPVIDAADSGDPEELKQRLNLAIDLDKISQDIVMAKNQVASQGREIEKLTNFVTDANSLKARSERKYRDVVEKLEKADEILQQREKETQVLENRLSLAQVVTAMGKLVSLSRQTLERENRWIDSLLGTELPPMDEDFKEALEQAKKIEAIKKKIAEETEYIRHLNNIMSPSAPQPSSGDRQYPQQPSFDDLW